MVPVRQRRRYDWRTVLSASSSAWTTSSWSGTVAVIDVIVSISDYASHVVPATTSENVQTSFRQYHTGPWASVFHVYPSEKHDCADRNATQTTTATTGGQTYSAGCRRNARTDATPPTLIATAQHDRRWRRASLLWWSENISRNALENLIQFEWWGWQCCFSTAPGASTADCGRWEKFENGRLDNFFKYF